MYVCLYKERGKNEEFVAFKISFIAPPLFSMWQDWMLKMSDCVSEQCCDATIRNTHTVVTTRVIFTSVINLKVFFSPQEQVQNVFKRVSFRSQFCLFFISDFFSAVLIDPEFLLFFSSCFIILKHATLSELYSMRWAAQSHRFLKFFIPLISCFKVLIECFCSIWGDT